MEQQNTHPLLPPAFTGQSFASTFPGAGTVSNPLLASTLHHLQELSVVQGATGLLPNSSQLTLSNQFATEFNNIAAVSWPTPPNANSAWFEQAKVAAMLPMYTVFSAGGLKPNETSAFDRRQVGRLVQKEVTNSVISSPSLPKHTGFLVSESDNNAFSSQPSTPKQLGQQKKYTISSAHSSPSSAMLVLDKQPSSIESHCSTKLRPCSISPMNTSSIPSQSSVGSVDHLPSSAESVHPEIADTKRPCSQQSCCSCTIIQRKDASTTHSPIAVAGLAHNRSMESHILTSQSKAVSTTISDRPSESRTTGLQTVQVDASSSVYRTSTPAQSSGAIVHENSMDQNNLEDIPWCSIDFSDIDLFNGSSASEKDVMHSVFDEMDPSVMHRLFLIEPSLASNGLVSDGSKITKLPLNVSHLITPKIREKIRLRRDKELADADKELDRLLSLVAKKDATSTPPPALFMPLEALSPILINNDNSSDRKISLSPVQFTPPDSPTPSTSAGVPPSSISNFFFPSSSSLISTATSRAPSIHSENLPAKTRFVFMPPAEKKRTSNKVPVYKQKAKSCFQSVIKTEEHAPSDEYSFTDDEEEAKPLPVSATVSDAQSQERRLDAEVAQKLARINSTHPEQKMKLDSDESQSQDLWRHVVPKKRHSAASERPLVPSTPLLPPASVNEHVMDSSSSQKTVRLQTVVDFLSLRRQHRSSFGFLKTKSLSDKETAKNKEYLKPSVVTIKEEPKDDSSIKSRVETQQPLPKLLIRLPRRSVDENNVAYEKSRMKKRKRKRKNSDHEWIDPESRKKKKKKHKHKHHHKNATNDASDCEDESVHKPSEQWSAPETSNKEAAFFSKKRRLIMHWNERGESRADSDYYRDQNSLVSFENGEQSNVDNDSSQLSVLSKFHPVDGHLAKGTFIVCKNDILKEDCPLWKVDNQNLLQKYPPFNIDGKIAYKNSSTYSGWCDQIADSYIVVRVRFIKHSRSESIVEPEMSLLDMFPAVSIEYEERPSPSLENVSEQRKNLFVDDPIRKQMAVYIKAMLNHALDMTFLQTLKQNSDWNYLCALNSIDNLNQQHKEKVRFRVKWIQRYLDLLHFYSSCVVCDSEGSGLNCQACGIFGVEKVVQLFCNEGYDYDTLEAEEVCYTGSGSPLHAVEYLVCSSCAKLSRIYHKLHHMRYMLLKICEDKLEKVSVGNADISSEVVVGACMNDVKWLRTVINEYADLWREIEMNDC
ncbi:unnamed protein product [Thelazia callipaeda]|uniref:DUF4211 domain-containing protein n=1 Tax=Thelazia callipaeda TaxID=103827 RepID=A0A0N5CZL3_THECL|nr:unnamed protein product [Thelazia callipaeda]